MKVRFNFRWFLRPEGLLVLMAVFWAWVHVMITGFGYDMSIFCAIPIFWPGEMILMPVVFLVFAGLYHFTRKYRQWPLLAGIHIASLFAIPALVYLWSPRLSTILYEFSSFPDKPMQEEWIRQVNRYNAFLDSAIKPIGVFIIAGQVVFIVNFIAGFVRGKKVVA
ncbi:hypothetical protein ACQKLP_00610 [Chitinophaga sp. NPDC101104]|uniref:hypothetical protein n=1 Tax=Chitinophaga sp. NPDC101104 TaxID=3390561 RepID=UPI003D028248